MRASALLRRPDFRRLFVAVSASELGDALQYIALMWIAFDVGGPLGVVAVRLADSVPALLFGLHGGLAADRWSRKRLMVGADLARTLVLVPTSLAAITGSLPLWGLVLAAFALETATSYFEPAYAATVPTLVDRANVQQANSLLQATAQTLSVGGWALAAALLAVVPVSVFFAVNAGSFLVSATLIAGLERGLEHGAGVAPPRLHDGFVALAPRPTLAISVVTLGIAVTISSGTWISGIPTLVGRTLGEGAAGFSIVMVGYAAGSVACSAILARFRIDDKARASCLAWTLYLPAYGLIAFAHSLLPVLTGAFLAGTSQTSALVLVRSAAQEAIPDHLLGRLLGFVSLAQRGAHAIGLMFVSPLFAVAAPRSIFAAAAIAIPAVAVVALAVAANVARAHEHRRPGPIGGPR